MGKFAYIGVKEMTYPDGVKLSDVARWNEYGTETIPPRPAFRMGAERSILKNKKLIQAMLKNMIRAKYRSKRDFENLEFKLLWSLGRSAVAETKKIIESGETAPNAPATVRKKGFDHPLFETGLLKKNVTFEVK